MNKNYEASKKLYDNGMISMQMLNKINIEKSVMNSKIVALNSQLQTLEINTKELTKATANFTLYAHSAGRVSKLYLPLHTAVKVNEALISIVKEQAFYVESYLPLEFASSVKVGQKLVINYNDKKTVSHVREVLPELDTKTQRVVVLSSIDEKVESLFINSYVSSRLYFDINKEYIGVKTTALSFLNNEWVVFVPKEEHHEESKEHHDDEDEHHDENEAPFEAKVVEVITQDDEFSAIKGLELGEEYISAKSYYVKSMMLKSSLGGHGH